jgi:DNA-binding LacI/PurR family transcriptional regulator
MALGVLKAAREAGLAVPGELSVVGFDDAPSAAEATPPLTTVRQPLLEKGRTAGRLVVEGAGVGASEVLLPVELLVRGSTARPA